jgi:hypothetical protein
VNTRQKRSSLKSINSSHKINHHSYKTAPIFTTFTHSTSVDSLIEHMCCDLQGIAEPTKIRNAASFLAAATVPELLYQNEHNTSNTVYSSVFHNIFRPFVSDIWADHKRLKHGRHKRPKYVAEHRWIHGVLSVVFVLIVEQMLIGRNNGMIIPKLTCPLILVVNLIAVTSTSCLYSSTAW